MKTKAEIFNAVFSGISMKEQWELREKKYWAKRREFERKLKQTKNKHFKTKKQAEQMAEFLPRTVFMYEGRFEGEQSMPTYMVEKTKKGWILKVIHSNTFSNATTTRTLKESEYDEYIDALQNHNDNEYRHELNEIIESHGHVLKPLIG